MHLILLPPPPQPPPKKEICITFVSHFSWVLQPSQKKLKTMLMQNFGGQLRCLTGDVQVANAFNITKLQKSAYKLSKNSNVFITQSRKHS